MVAGQAPQWIPRPCCPTFELVIEPSLVAVTLAGPVVVDLAVEALGGHLRGYGPVCNLNLD